jgi:hypothetical protein
VTTSGTTFTPFYQNNIRSITGVGIHLLRTLTGFEPRYQKSEDTIVKPQSNKVRSLIKLKANATSRSMAVIELSYFYCFYGAILDSYWEKHVALDSESCSSSRDVGMDSFVQLCQ